MANLDGVALNRLWLSARIKQTGFLAATIAGSAVLALIGLPWVAGAAAVAGVVGAPRIARRQIVGARGERLAIAELKRLPDDHYVFNQVRIPRSWSPTGFLEADLVVVSPTRVAIIEVKNYGGAAAPVSTGRSWQVKGRSGVRQLRNPIDQAVGQAQALGEWLRDHGQRVWVEPAVFFANPQWRLKHRPDNTAALLWPNDLQPYFAHRQPSDAACDAVAIAKLLTSLKSGKAPAPVDVEHPGSSNDLGRCRWAIQQNRPDVVKEWVGRPGRTVKQILTALCWAAEKDSLQALDHLLSGLPAHVRPVSALVCAARAGQVAAVARLLPVSQVDQALSRLHEQGEQAARKLIVQAQQAHQSTQTANKADGVAPQSAWNATLSSYAWTRSGTTNRPAITHPAARQAAGQPVGDGEGDGRVAKRRPSARR